MLLDFFSQAKVQDRPLSDYLLGKARVEDLETLKEVLDYVHISQGLLRVFGPDYPLIEPRELLPSFEDSLQEYHYLPGFSLLALDRELDYQNERFQFDLLKSKKTDSDEPFPLRLPPPASNATIFKARLPRELHLDFDTRLGDRDITQLENYPSVLDFVFHMDRGHVLAQDHERAFRFMGVFASFPSNLDQEIKSFGRKIGKFVSNDNKAYEKNRLMVYKFLMELYGFPIASERRTSAALFARDLTFRRERFIIKTLGQSDRVITTLYHPDGDAPYPQVEKTALIRLAIKSKEHIRDLEQEGYFVDPDRRIVLIRALYAQHPYNKRNIMEDRALSLEQQEIVHPRTGERLPWLNVLQAREDRLLTLNDIVRGEHSGRIVFQNQEIIEGTDDHEKRLKFLSAWLQKHQRRFVSASPAFLDKVEQIVDSYILNPEIAPEFKSHLENHRQILGQMAYIKQANSVHRLESLLKNKPRVKYLEQLEALIDFLVDNQYHLNGYYEDVFEKLMFLYSELLSDKYLLKNYILSFPNTEYGRKVAARYAELTELKNDIQDGYYAQYSGQQAQNQ